MRDARRPAVGVMCGIVAGAVAGLAARVAMRMVALGVADGVGITPDFTIAGTLLIVASGMIVGAPTGLVYGLIADRLPGPARVRGLVFAGMLLALVGPFFFLGNEEFFSVGRVALFVPLFAIFGAMLGVAFVPARARFAPAV